MVGNMSNVRGPNNQAYVALTPISDSAIQFSIECASQGWTQAGMSPPFVDALSARY
jgi:hypothetical protein